MILKSAAGRGCAVGFLLLMSNWGVAAAELPPGDTATHLGVATCASSFCHGATSAKDDSNVLQNEYLTWQREDPHAGAYRILLNEESAAISRRMGLGAPENETLCLNCHTDNATDTGERFRRDDGIGCEACHGGAEHWIDSHATDGRRHTENLEAGLYPLETPSARARLCQSCHVGDAQRPMNHDLLGAGHPPLLFELDTFAAILPQHYRIDADYRERKGKAEPVEFWVAGQLEEAARYLAKLDRNLGPAAAAKPAHWPELSVFNCQSCHHVIESDPARPLQPQRSGLPSLRTAPLQKLLETAEVLAPGGSREFHDALESLARHGGEGSEAEEALATLRNALGSLRSDMAESLPIDRATWQRLLLAASDPDEIPRGLQGRELFDHRVMSLGVLLQQGKQQGWLAANEHERLSAALDRCYALLQDPYEFNAYALRVALADLNTHVQEFD